MCNLGKRCVLLIMAVLLLIGLTACEKVDKTPTLTLEGPEVMEITLGDGYPEHGFSATDYQGNDISNMVELDMPDLDLVGDQIVKYSVTCDGITVTETKILKIKHKVPDLEDWTYYNHGVPILMYHYVYDPDNPPENLHANYISTDDLESHLKFLVEEDYYFPTWREIRDFVDCKIDLPEKSVVLCFDDGSKNFIELGIPLLEKYGVRATSFVIASKNGEEMAAMDLKHVQLQSHSYDMHRGGGYIGHGGIFTALGYEEALADLKTSIEILGNGDAFAYPYGDYTDYCMQTVEDAGFLCAVTTEYGRVYPGDNPYALSRVRIALGNGLEIFQSLVQ